MQYKKLIAAMMLTGFANLAIAETGTTPNNNSGNGQNSSNNSQVQTGLAPPAAACKDKALGASCNFVGPTKQWIGNCYASPLGADKPLVCHP